MADTSDFDDAPDAAGVDDFDAAPDAVGLDAPAPPSRGSFFDYLKARFSGQPDVTPDVGSVPGVRTIQTPTGKTYLDAQGRPVRTPQESQQMFDANEAKFRQRVLEGGLSTLSGGGTMMDELNGAMAVGDPRQRREGEAMGDRYRRVRDTTRRDVDTATRNASPTVSVGDVELPGLPMVGAALPSLMAPLPGGAFARILSGGATAAIDQAGRSEVDVSRGDNLTDFAADLVKSGGMGLGFSGLAEGLALPARAIGRGATSQAAGAAQAAEAANAAKAAKALASAEGRAGGITTGGMSTLRAIDETAANINGKYTAQEVAAALAAQASPEMQAIREAANLNTIAKLPRYLPAQAKANAAMTTAAEAATPSVVALKTAGQLDPATAMSDWGEKAWNSVGQRAVGSAMGGAAGAGADWLMGNEHHQGGFLGIGAGVMSAPGMVQFMRNTRASPVMLNMASRGLASAASSTVDLFAREGLVGAAMSRGAVATPETAPQRQQSAFEALAQRFGINAKSKEELANEHFLRSSNAGTAGLLNGR